MKNLLVPVDFSDATERVVAAAEQMALAFGAKVWLLHCVAEDEPVGVIGEIPIFVSRPDLPIADLHRDEHRKLMDLGRSMRSRGIDAEEILVSGSAIDRIMAAAAQHDVDMIVVGSHGHGALYELFVGTVTKSVVMRVGLPTLIVPTGTHAREASSESTFASAAMD